MSTLFKKGNRFQLFFHNGTGWTALSYATSHTYSLNDNYEDVACKEFGLFPKKDLTSSGVEVSGEYLYSPDGFAVLSGMQEDHKEYSFCFANVSAYADSTDAAYAIGTAAQGAEVIKYFNAMVSVELSSEAGSNATMSITLTGSTKPTSTPQSTIVSYVLPATLTGTLNASGSTIKYGSTTYYYNTTSKVYVSGAATYTKGDAITTITVNSTSVVLYQGIAA